MWNGQLIVGDTVVRSDCSSVDSCYKCFVFKGLNYSLCRSTKKIIQVEGEQDTEEIGSYHGINSKKARTIVFTCVKQIVLHHGRKSMTGIKVNSEDISALNTEQIGSCHGTNEIRTRRIFYCLTLGRNDLQND